MENWVYYGLFAALVFGINTVIYKFAQQKGNMSPYYGSFLMGLGIVIVFGVFMLFNRNFEFEWKSSSLALGAGMLWAIGFLAVAIAISQKADVSRLAPIYNTNTLVAVVLGIIFLKEIPDASQMIRVISGALLIVGGAVLVSI